MPEKGALIKKAALLREDILLLAFALRHPDTPWYARLLVILVVAYAISPVDLIPDFIPVLGLVDDLIIVPAGIWLALKLLPESVISECRQRARAWTRRFVHRPLRWLGLVLVITIWAVLLWLLWHFWLALTFK